MGPGVDEVVQLVSRTLSGAHVTVTLQGVGVADVTEVKAALDQLFDGSLSSGVGNPAGEIADHADGWGQHNYCMWVLREEQDTDFHTRRVKRARDRTHGARTEPETEYVVRGPNLRFIETKHM